MTLIVLYRIMVRKGIVNMRERGIKRTMLQEDWVLNVLLFSSIGRKNRDNNRGNRKSGRMQGEQPLLPINGMKRNDD